MTVESFTPSQVIQELRRIQTEASKGSQALYDAEVLYAEAENAYETVLQKAFIRSEGTVADRTAVSRLEAAEARLQADLRKAEVNRIKQKLKPVSYTHLTLPTTSRV